MQIGYLITAFFGFVLSTACYAGISDDADFALARWAAAYTSNDIGSVVANYWPDATLLGTTSPVMSEGEDAIRSYFASVIKPGNRNVIGDRRALVIDDSAVLITGFYEFTRIRDGVAVQGPSRFSMLMIKRGAAWRILHHHSSPYVAASIPAK